MQDRSSKGILSMYLDRESKAVYFRYTVWFVPVPNNAVWLKNAPATFQIDEYLTEGLKNGARY